MKTNLKKHTRQCQATETKLKYLFLLFSLSVSFICFHPSLSFSSHRLLLLIHLSFSVFVSLCCSHLSCLLCSPLSLHHGPPQHHSVSYLSLHLHFLITLHAAGAIFKREAAQADGEVQHKSENEDTCLSLLSPFSFLSPLSASGRKGDLTLRAHFNYSADSYTEKTHLVSRQTAR